MNFWGLFLEMWYILIAFILLATGVKVYQSVGDNRKFGGFLFWGILAVLFGAGPYLPNIANGVLVLGLGVLSALKMVNIGDVEQIAQEFKDSASDRIGGIIFLPSVIIAAGAFILAYVLPMVAGDGASATVLGYIAIGISSTIGLVVLLLITKSPAKFVVTDGTRLMRAMGSFSILPQLLGALGAIFTAAGLGSAIATALGVMIPQGNAFVGVVAYCVGMAVFTMIMGNAFAAFTVITVGVGVPFVFALGANPVIAGALAMTAGFCGTLMTPMAANFNIVSATLLETKSEYAVIKYQVPFALVLLMVHILLMYFLAF